MRLTSPQIARQLGGNITSSVAVFTGLIASIIFGLLVIRLRRPVAHLIRNRSLAQRLKQPSLQESLRIFSGLWYWPIVLMVLVSAINLIGIGEDNQKALRCALFTTVLLIGTVFLSTILQHLFKSRKGRSDPAQQRLQGAFSQPAARVAADRHRHRVHRYSRADLGRVAARFRPEQHGRPGHQQRA